MSGGSRAAALEAKRAKLEELRRQRQSRLQVSSTGKNPVVDENVVNSLVDELVPRSRRSTAAPVDAVEAETTTPSSAPAARPRYVSVAVGTEELERSEHAGPRDEVITYEKGTQTVDSDDELLVEKPDAESEHELRQRLESEIREEIAKEQAAHTKMDTADGPGEKVVVDDSKLAEFVGRSFQIVDRAIANDRLFEDKTTNGLDSAELVSNDPLVFQSELHHDIVGSKSVTSFDWSPFAPLLAVSYSTLPPQQKDKVKGLIVVWNMKTRKPEYSFHSSTEVLVVKFALHKRSVLYAGGYNGKVLQYDMNSDSRYPVAHTPISSRFNTHSHPIYSILQVNSSHQGPGDLVSCSTDGKICRWSPFLLDKPVSEPLQLNTSNSKYDEDVLNSMVKLSNGSLLLGGSSLNVLENLEAKFKRFDPEFARIVTGLQARNGKILCSSIDSIALYDESSSMLKRFLSSSMIMDIAWLDDKFFVAATGRSLELFDTTKNSNFSTFECPTNEYINKVSSHEGLVVAGTDTGKLLLFRYNQ